MKKSIYDIEAFESFLESTGYSVRDLRRVRRMLFREYKRLDDLGLEANTSKDLHKNFETCHLKLVSRQDSGVDGASKLLFETADGKRIETVILRINTGRTSICVSSQVGCTEACKFCATGEMGFFRNLRYEEIIDQVVQAGRIIASEGRTLRNIVFMGMGEPLRNYDNLVQTLDTLLDGKVFQFADKYITVSSLGIPELIIKFAERFPKVGLALSLNASNDDIRSKIMPINDKHTMAELRSMLEKLKEIRSSNVMIEYIMFKDLNDNLECAAEVADFLKGLDVHINLIPYNPDYSLDRTFKSSQTVTVINFQKHLQDKGYTVTRRFSLGQDIAAACGQLANKE